MIEPTLDQLTAQLAASRMQTARLHLALVLVKDALQHGAGLDTHVAANGPTVREAITEALSHSEPAVLAELADAEREANAAALIKAARAVVEAREASEGFEDAEFCNALAPALVALAAAVKGFPR